MRNPVKIIECPRDAWQGLPGHIPAAAKAEYLQSLIHAGFRHIDAVSFVSPGAVPQLADSEAVLAQLHPAPEVEIIGIVVNARGAERAIATGRVQTLGFPFSISEVFLQRNQHQSTNEALLTLRAMTHLARQSGLSFVAYISMAFGNPYGEEWRVDKVVAACSNLISLGIQQISLADTVGLADPAEIQDVLTEVVGRHPTAEIGLHLHARPDTAAAKVRAAYGAGCRRFDSAIGGLGGCPFAQDALVGNIPTELLLATLRELGAAIPSLTSLHTLQRRNAEIAAAFASPPTWESVHPSPHSQETSR